MSEVVHDLPISNDQLKALFDYLDQPNSMPCTHTFKEATEFLISNQLPIKETLYWLVENGAGCGCEVISNTDAEWGETVGRVLSDEDL